VVLDDAFNYLRIRGLVGSHQSVDLSDVKFSGSNDYVDSSNDLDLSRIHNNHVQANPVESTDSNGDGVTTGYNNGGVHVNGAHINIDDVDAYAIIPLSAADEDGPYRQAEGLEDFLTALPREVKTTDFVSDLVHTLATRRSLLSWRAFAVINSKSDTIHSVRDTLTPPTLSISSKTPELSFVFTGQGAQYARMGLELLSYPVFKNSMDSCDAFLKSVGCTWSIHGLSSPTSSQ
jgi:acyl transferase domain-containing protein